VTDAHDNSIDHLTSLLADRAIEGLADEEHAELARLLGEEADRAGSDLEAAAAVLQVALIDPRERAAGMPESLRRSILEGPPPSSVTIADAAGAAAATTARPAPPATGGGSPPTEPVATISPWPGWIAAAACLVLAVLAWWPATTPPPDDRRAALLADDSARPVQWDWSVVMEDYVEGPVSGDVVWSTPRSEGYMTIAGLPPLDPDEQQYQLWIFRRAPGEEAHPVDGGVFDVPAGGGPVVIPIDARVPLRGDPAAFAITVEPAGGVVVSDRQRLPLIASPAVG